MNPISFTLIFLSLAAFLYVLIPLILPGSKKRLENLLIKLSKIGASNNLTFCSQEILQNKVIGIDGIHRKIMILERVKGGYQSSIISLDEVHDCQLITNSGAITRENLKKIINDKITSVSLQFEFINHTQPVSIVFTNGITNSKNEFELLKAKAQYWCAMFSKMLTPQMEARA